MTASSGIERVEAALTRATGPAGEGSRTFILLDADDARLAAEPADTAGVNWLVQYERGAAAL